MVRDRELARMVEAVVPEGKLLLTDDPERLWGAWLEEEVHGLFLEFGDGWEGEAIGLLEEIRKREREFPVLAAGKPGKELLLVLMPLGLKRFLPKPVSKEVLAAALDEGKGYST